MNTPPTKSAYRRWVVLFGLAIGALAAGLASLTPTPLGPDAPAAQFSAGRAMADVRAIAARPHPSGSPDLARVRGYLLSRLGALGIPAETQSGEGVLTAAKHKPGVLIAGAMTNVVGVLPGRDRTAPAVLVMAHYDTMPNTPGAGDDTAGVAAALEIARALKTDGDRTRDVIFLFTDGEEPGLLGAQIFFASHPLARHVGLVLNMEARGDTGRVAMFETSRDAGALVRMVGAKAPGPSANSLMAALYRVMPNDTDLTIPLDRGVPGLNFAFAGDQLAYHTSLSTPDHLDPGSVQHMGDQVLPVVRALARGAELPGKAPDLVYSDLMGRLLVAYPPWIGWVICAVAAGLVLGSIAWVRRRGAAGWGDLARGAGGMLFVTMAVALGLHLGGRWLGGEDSVRVYALVARYPLLLAGASAIALGVGTAIVGAMAQGGRRLPFVLAAVLAGAGCSLGGFDLVGVVLGVLTAVLALLCLGRPTSLWGFWTGALAVGLAGALILQVLVPATAFLAQWPLIVAGLAAATLLAFRIEADSWPGLAILGLLAALGFAQIASWASGFFVQMGPVVPELLAVFAPLALLVLAPGLHGFGSDIRWRAGALGAVALGAILLVLVGGEGWPGASPRRLTQLFDLADPQSRSFHRASATRTLDPWSLAALGGDPRRLTSVKAPLVTSGRIWFAPPRPLDIDGPALSAEADTADGQTHVTLRVRPTAPGRQLKLLIQPTGALSDLTLNGRPRDTLREAKTMSLDRMAVVYFAPPAEGVTLGFRASAHGRFEVQALEQRDGWPAGDTPPPPRPDGLLAWGLSGATVVQNSLDYSW